MVRDKVLDSCVVTCSGWVKPGSTSTVKSHPVFPLLSKSSRRGPDTSLYASPTHSSLLTTWITSGPRVSPERPRSPGFRLRTYPSSLVGPLHPNLILLPMRSVSLVVSRSPPSWVPPLKPLKFTKDVLSHTQCYPLSPLPVLSLLFPRIIFWV